MATDPRLERIRQMMKEEAEKKSGNNRGASSGDNASYPFWNIPKDTTALLRFLPDKDDTNPWFWIERQTITLKFHGIVGGENPTNDLVTVKVPCVNMFEKNTCPIIAETKPWWRDESKKSLAQEYYKKSSFIAQGFVVQSPFEEKAVPENPIRRFIIGNEILEILKAGMADPDMEFLPTDYLNGTDFRVRKTIRQTTINGQKKEFNNYSTSKFVGRPRPLNETELAAIEQYGLFNLADFRGPRPDADGVAAIKAMFHASLNGEPFDFEAFGKYPWRPYGSNADSSEATTASNDEPDETTTNSVAASTPARKADDGAAAPSKQSDIIAKLRERIPSRS